MKAKHQRLVLLGLAVVAVLAAVLLAMSRANRQPISTSGDIAREGVPLDAP